MSLETLRDNIIEGVRSDGEKRLDNRKKQLHYEIQKFEEETTSQLQEKKETFQSRMNKEKSQEKRKADRNNSNEVLLEKEAMIENVVGDALLRMENFSEDHLDKLFQAAIQGIETDQPFELRLGDRTSAINEEWVAKHQEDYPKMQVSGRSVRNEAGFILAQDGKEYNYIFNELLSEMKPDLIALINDQLFQ